MYCGPNLRLTYEVSSAFVKGLQLVVTNRSPEKAAQLAERCATFFFHYFKRKQGGGATYTLLNRNDRFGGRFVSLDRLEEELSSDVAVRSQYLNNSSEISILTTDCLTACVQVVISTVPATANFTLPTSILKQKPVILDVVYKPAKTLLVAQVRDRCFFSWRGLNVGGGLQALAAGAPLVQGATMLLEQALEQFRLWHGRPAPRAVMEEAVFRGVERLDEGFSRKIPKP